MSSIFIPKTIIVKDEFGVSRQAFVANESIPEHIYNETISKETVVNPEDLPAKAVATAVVSLSTKSPETKELPEDSVDESNKTDLPKKGTKGTK